MPVSSDLELCRLIDIGSVCSMEMSESESEGPGRSSN